MNFNRKNRYTSARKGVASLCGALVMSGVLFLPGKGMTQNYLLSSGGTSAELNLGAGSGGTGNIGMNNWSVFSHNQLNQQWFWYSINGGAPQSIDTIGGLTATINAPNDLTVTYQNSLLSVNVEYVLTGVTPGSADMLEYIWIDNISASSTLNLSFYQYSNFNLFGNNNNTVNITGNPTDGFAAALQTANVPGGNGIAEVIDAPNANYAEAALVGQTLGELNGPSYLTLNDNTGPVTGDVTWAFQWNAANFSPGDELDISKDKGLSIAMVPEPSTFAFIALGLGAWGWARRRQ